MTIGRKVKYIGDRKGLTIIGIDRDIISLTGVVVNMYRDLWCEVEYEFDEPMVSTGKATETYDVPMNQLEEVDDEKTQG